MDPNANLREQRQIITRVLTDDIEPRIDDLCRLVELAEAMDRWLTNGGFLPDAWKRKRLAHP